MIMIMIIIIYIYIYLNYICHGMQSFRGMQQLEGDKVQHCCGGLVVARKEAHRHDMILRW